MNRRRFAPRTRALLAAAALPALALAQAQSQVGDGAKAKDPVESQGSQSQVNQQRQDERLVAKHAEETQKIEAAKQRQRQVGEVNKLVNPLGPPVPAQQAPAKKVPPPKNAPPQYGPGPDPDKIKLDPSKGTRLEERWQRERDAKLAAALRRAGKLLG